MYPTFTLWPMIVLLFVAPVKIFLDKMERDYKIHPMILILMNITILMSLLGLAYFNFDQNDAPRDYVSNYLYFSLIWLLKFHNSNYEYGNWSLVTDIDRKFCGFNVILLVMLALFANQQRMVKRIMSHFPRLGKEAAQVMFFEGIFMLSLVGAFIAMVMTSFFGVR